LPDPPSIPPIGVPLVELQSIDSTNNYARLQIHAGLTRHGTVYFAHEQSAGKGQRGKSWTSDKGMNIIMSTVVDPALIILSRQFQLSVCVAVSVVQFFQEYAGDETKIKWPNDLYWQDRKAGGILIENIVKINETGNPKWIWSIAGIGININQTQFESALRNPVSLKQIRGKTLDVLLLAKQLLEILNTNFQKLITGQFEKLYQYYIDHLYKKDQKVFLKKDNRVFEATIKSVTQTGKLVIEHAFQEEFSFGEIEWVM
jgi:BirA family biotin operon repressor/biotin-[acetyl-CoA-carboxylase] ligase